jgi:hypothetical protein
MCLGLDKKVRGILYLLLFRENSSIDMQREVVVCGEKRARLKKFVWEVLTWGFSI